MYQIDMSSTFVMEPHNSKTCLGRGGFGRRVRILGSAVIPAAKCSAVLLVWFTTFALARCSMSARRHLETSENAYGTSLCIRARFRGVIKRILKTVGQKQKYSSKVHAQNCEVRMH